jgi:hypothetical protein
MKELISAPVLVGKTPDGARVFVQVNLSPVTGHRETVDHEQGDGGWRLSISGHSIERGHREPDTFGQILDQVRAAHSELAREILPIWVKWHLNDMQAGCAHQGKPTRSVNGVLDLDSVDRCPVTGYQYGRSWLYLPLPDEIVTWAQKFIADHPNQARDI